MTSTLTYQPTRQRDRYRVFDGRTFLGVVERPRMSGSRHNHATFWIHSLRKDWVEYFLGWKSSNGQAFIYTTRTEAAEALRQTRRQEAG